MSEDKAIYRNIFKCFMLAIKEENIFLTIGMLIIFTVILMLPVGLLCQIIHLIHSKFYVNPWCVASISLFLSSLLISGSIISQRDKNEKSIEFHIDFEKKIRHFISECEMKNIDTKSIVKDITLSIDMLYDPKIKYYYCNPIKTLDEKIKEMQS